MLRRPCHPRSSSSHSHYSRRHVGMLTCLDRRRHAFPIMQADMPPLRHHRALYAPLQTNVCPNRVGSSSTPTLLNVPMLRISGRLWREQMRVRHNELFKNELFLLVIAPTATAAALAIKPAPPTPPPPTPQPPFSPSPCAPLTRSTCRLAVPRLKPRTVGMYAGVTLWVCAPASAATLFLCANPHVVRSA